LPIRAKAFQVRLRKLAARKASGILGYIRRGVAQQGQGGDCPWSTASISECGAY